MLEHYPSHHSYETNVTRPEGDALLIDSDFLHPDDSLMPSTVESTHRTDTRQSAERRLDDLEEFTGPRNNRHELLMHQADIELQVATELEEALGMDVAGPSYEKAMQYYLGSIFVRGVNEPEPDYALYLKLGGVQARVATWKELEPYKTVMTREKQKELAATDPEAAKNVTHRPSSRRGFDRRNDLFSSSEECFEIAEELALEASGGKLENIPADVLARIFSERANMYAIQGLWRNTRGEKSEAQKDLMQALTSFKDAQEVVNHSYEAEIDPNLAHMIEEQGSEVLEVMRGKQDTSEVKKLAAESLHDLALSS